MSSATLVPFFVPMVGASVTFLLNRGSRLRRARSAALDDLQLHERALQLLGAGDPLIDQVRAHARESLKTYGSQRAAAEKRAAVWLSVLVMLIASVVLGTTLVSLKLDNVWEMLALGVVVGAIGIGAEAGVQRLVIRRALRSIPTNATGKPPEAV